MINGSTITVNGVLAAASNFLKGLPFVTANIVKLLGKLVFAHLKKLMNGSTNDPGDCNIPYSPTMEIEVDA